MRQEYWQLAWSRLRGGQWRWLFDQAYKRLAVKKGFRRGRPFCGPILGSILVTYRCDNRCLMCDYPGQAVERKKDSQEELNEEELLCLVDDFSAIGSSSLSLTGGEPLLRQDVFRLLHRIREKGMLSNINSNGNLLHREDLAAKLLETGVDLINISVDGSSAKVHDHLRGIKGGFDKLMTAIEHFNRLKKEKSYKTLINIVTVLSRENLHQIPDMLALARRLKVNRIGFLPVHNFDFMTDPLQGQDPSWFQELDKVICLLKDEVKKGLVDNSPEYLDFFKNHFRGESLPIPCYAAYSSLMINAYGEIFPCFPWIERKKTVGDIRETPLRDFWASEAYNERRREISACRECFWNCHSELNLAL
jgi:MoaA/NifB/PqqE/SkfB family radical SAM enzyme